MGKNDENCVLTKFGKGMLVVAILGFLGVAAYWLLKLVLLVVFIWFLVFKLPLFF